MATKRSEASKAQRAAYAARYRREKAEAVRAYRDANRGRITDRAAQEWQRDNPDRAAENHARYRKRRPEKVRSRARNREALKRGANGTHTADDIARLFENQFELCAACYQDIAPGFEIDHVMPVSRGGGNGPENLQLLCRPCNRRKHAKHPDDWAKEVAA